MEYLSLIIPPEIIAYHVKPYMKARDVVKLFGYNAINIDKRLSLPITYRIFTMSMGHKCKRCIVYKTHGDVITDFTVSNYYSGKEITYFSWSEEEDLVYAKQDGIYYDEIYIKSYDVYPHAFL